MMHPENGTILIVDDDKDILLTAKMVLKGRFKHIITENDPHKISRILEQETCHVVLLDMNFTAGFTSGKEGLRWLKKIRKMSPRTEVVLMTAYGEVSLAVQAMKSGAADFVVKPWENEQLEETVAAAIRASIEAPEIELPPVLTASDSKSVAAHDPYEMIGKSSVMQKVLTTIEKVAKTDANVLILGENGTGKELVARALHRQSARAGKAFIHVDLGAVPESLFESELFGHVKGAFTDAREDRAGRFEAANGGTLFLDEIGNLSLPLQAKLLSALQSRMVTRVGSNRPISIDLRLVCATNMPLYEMVRDKEFRQDLIYRINTVEVMLPPLRERAGDISLLVRHFLQIYHNKYQREEIRLEEDILQRMQTYGWPGNIRELQHAVERAVIMGEPESLVPQLMSQGNTPLTVSAPDYNLEEVEKAAIKNAISKHEGNISKAAKELGLGRTTLYRKMNKYGL